MKDLCPNPQSALDFDKEVFLSKSNLKSIHKKQKRQNELFEDSDDDLFNTSNNNSFGTENVDDLELFGENLIDDNVTAESICAVSIVTPNKESDHALDERKTSDSAESENDDLISRRTRSHSTQETTPHVSENSGWGQLTSSTRRVRKVAKAKSSNTEDVDLDLFGGDLVDDNVTAESTREVSTVSHDKDSDSILDRSHLKRKTSSSTQDEDDLISCRTRSHSTQGETLNASGNSGWGQLTSATRVVRKATVVSQPHFRVPPQTVTRYTASSSMVRTEGAIEETMEYTAQFLLRYMFEDRVKIYRHYSMRCEELNETKYLNGTPWQLIATKHVKPKGHGFYDGGPYIRAYYIQGESNKLKRELEQLADFGSLWYNPGKLAMRIELLVTPASKAPFGKENYYMFKRPLEDFEVVNLPENSTMGCGFIPLKLLKELVGYGSKGENAVAVQVRVLSPHLGLFKGMLVAKPGIEKIQLNNSMQKVGPSVSPKKNKKLLNQVLLLFNNVCPSERSDNLERGFNPNYKLKPRKESDTSSLLPSFEHVLRCSVQDGKEEEFETLFEDYKAASDHGAYQHASLTGVCDPTVGSIPEGQVFISSFPFGFNDGKKYMVSLTRVPCTEAADLVTVPVVTNKPRGMGQDDWEFLTNLSFGAIIFGTPKDTSAQSLPEQINDSDLDGDLFSTIWNQSIVKLVSNSKKQGRLETDQYTFKLNDEIEALFDFRNDGVYSKDYHPGNVWKLPYREEGGEELYDIKYKSGEIRKNVSVDKIRPYTVESYPVKMFTRDRKGDNKIEVEVEFENGKREWRDLDVLIDNGFEDELAVYAKENNLMDKDGWAFAKHVSFRDSPIIKVNDLKLKNNICQAQVLYDGDIQMMWVEAKTVDVDLLYEYLLANESRRRILQKSKKWNWLEKDIAKKQADWVDVLQMELTSAKLHQYDLFIKSLHREYKNLSRSHNQSDADAFGRAYKAANDVRKHGGRVKLPAHLRDVIATKNRQFFHEFIEDI